MPKINWKRVIAREWLFLLCIGVGGYGLAAGIYFVAQPERVEQTAKSFLAPNDKPFDVWITREYIDSISKVPEEESNLTPLERGKLIVLLLKKGDQQQEKWGTRVKWEYAAEGYEDQQRLKAYRRSVSKLDDIFGIVRFIPYPLFLFIRTIPWAVRQVRRPKASGS